MSLLNVGVCSLRALVALLFEEVSFGLLLEGANCADPGGRVMSFIHSCIFSCPSASETYLCFCLAWMNGYISEGIEVGDAADVEFGHDWFGVLSVVGF